ncbi:MAG: hypothetical protein U0556_16665 [Dehalococcoidia bacterium]
MQNPCKVCPQEQKFICFARERAFSFLGLQFVEDWRTIGWDAKAEELFAGGLSDGTVPHSMARELAAAIEHTAKQRGHTSVSVADVAYTMVESATSYDYWTTEAIDPAYQTAVDAMPSMHQVTADGWRMIRAKARAERESADWPEHFAELAREVRPNDGEAHHRVADRPLTWCGHVHHVLAIMMNHPSFDDETMTTFVETCEQVAVERGHRGVTPRDFETALLRVGAGQPVLAPVN